MSNNNIALVKGHVKLFCAGGAAINIGSQLEDVRARNEDGFSILDIVYIDTSRSNIKPSIAVENCYLMEGMDGSGQVRSENHVEIGKQIKTVTHKFKPADLNIVLHSASGGSGSVIGPLLARELLSNDESVIVITIGSANTKKEVENTIKTVKTYGVTCDTLQKPIAMNYLQNSDHVSRVTVDNQVKELILALCVLFSRQNRELDSKDLFNFLRFERARTVTSFGPQVAGLYLYYDANDIADVGNIITVATLAQVNAPTALRQMPEYQCVGFLSDGEQEMIVQKLPMHFVTCDGVIIEQMKHLQKQLDELEQSQHARIDKGSLLSAHDQPNQNGLIL